MRETVIILFAMSAVMTLCIIALLKNIDGAVLASGFTVIGGLGGWSAGKRRQKSLNGKTVLPQPEKETD